MTSSPGSLVSTNRRAHAESSPYASAMVAGASSSAVSFLTSSLSLSGTPISSQMTVSGSGYANVSITSTSSSVSQASSRSLAICSTRGRRASMRRVENARAIGLRSRVWSGGSRWLSMPPGMIALLRPGWLSACTTSS